MTWPWRWKWVQKLWDSLIFRLAMWGISLACAAYTAGDLATSGEVSRQVHPPEATGCEECETEVVYIPAAEEQPRDCSHEVLQYVRSLPAPTCPDVPACPAVRCADVTCPTPTVEVIAEAPEVEVYNVEPNPPPGDRDGAREGVLWRRD